MVNDEFCFRGSGGMLGRPMSKVEGKATLQRVHDLSCGDNDISLYRHLYRQGYYWPKMFKEATELQRSCTKCRESLDVGEPLLFKRSEIRGNHTLTSHNIDYCHIIILM